MKIELHKISYTYDCKAKALNNINLSIHQGERIALIGKSGSGKSTLALLLNGLLKPTEGKICVDDMDIHSSSYSLKELRYKVGVVFQYPEYQLFEKDVLSDVMFGPLNKGLSSAEAKEKAREALKLVGISEDKWYNSPFDLSGGEKRRVAIAGVLAMKPEVLILDEPVAGIDAPGKKLLFEEISELNKLYNTTIILISHDMNDCLVNSNRTIVLSSGNILMDDYTHEVFKDYKKITEAGLSLPVITSILFKLKDKGYDVNTSLGNVGDTINEIKQKVIN